MLKFFYKHIWRSNLIFKPAQMKKNLSYKVIQNCQKNTLVKENIIQLTHCVCRIVLKCQKKKKKSSKKQKKKLQKTHLWLNLPPQNATQSLTT